jgi:hypothetical protein
LKFDRDERPLSAQLKAAIDARAAHRGIIQDAARPQHVAAITQDTASFDQGTPGLRADSKDYSKRSNPSLLRIRDGTANAGFASPRDAALIDEQVVRLNCGRCGMSVLLRLDDIREQRTVDCDECRRLQKPGAETG